MKQVKHGITRRLTSKEVPHGSVIGVLSDVHIPHHDERAVKLIIECMEDAGVTHVILNGDIADCGPASRHDSKKKRAVLDEGTLRESVAAGIWVFDWARTRPCWYILGNHEAWVENYIESSPELKGSTAVGLMGLWEDGDGWEVLPSMSRVRYGSRCWEHGNGFFPSGGGGANPWMRVKSLAPDQTTSVGHLHRQSANFWTTTDERGFTRTRGVFCNGHLSVPESHEDYAGGYLNWQQGAEITRVYVVDGKPRFTTNQIEVHRDSRGRPVFEYNGRVYRG